jgi:hypothetical protein
MRWYRLPLLWNLRLDLGQHLSPSPMRLTEFAPARVLEPSASEPVATPTASEPIAAPTCDSPVYGPPRWARRSWTSGFAGADFALQPDGTLRCPAGHPLTVQERRPERNGSVRVVYGARACHCRPCPLREQCQESTTTHKPRQVSAVLWPLEDPASPPVRPLAHPVEASSTVNALAPTSPPQPALHPVLWGDWPRCHLRRQWIRLLRTQTVDLSFGSANLEEMQEEEEALHVPVQTRAQRAHYRLSWQQRMARNARLSSALPLDVTIHGLPAAFAQFIGLNGITTA